MQWNYVNATKLFESFVITELLHVAILTGNHTMTFTSKEFDYVGLPQRPNTIIVNKKFYTLYRTKFREKNKTHTQLNKINII